MIFFILILMIFLHIVDDYYLQGILAKLKQKTWWEENAPNKLYKNDYKIALFMHAFSWSFMIMIPIWVSVIMRNDSLIAFIIIFLINVLLHAIIDHLKANALKINLITDQILHIMQIIVTWLFYILLGGCI